MACLFLVALSPAATAQDPSRPAIEFAVTRLPDLGPEGFLTPAREIAAFDVQLAVGCSAQQLQPSPSNRVVFEIEPLPPYVWPLLSVDEYPFSMSPQSCSDQAFRARVPATVRLTTDRSAPAFETFAVSVKATVEEKNAAGGVDRFGPFLVTVNLTNDFAFDFDVSGQSSDRKAPGEPFEISLDVTNSGNGELAVRFELSQPGPNKVRDVVGPAPIVLQSIAQVGQGARFREAVSVKGLAPATIEASGDNYVFDLKTIAGSTDARMPATHERVQSLLLQVVDEGPRGAMSPGLGFDAALLSVALFLVASRYRRA